MELSASTFTDLTLFQTGLENRISDRNWMLTKLLLHLDWILLEKGDFETLIWLNKGD